MVETNHPKLAVVRQCRPLGDCHHSTFCYMPSEETPKIWAQNGLPPDEATCGRHGPPAAQDRNTEAA